jgi:peptide deformylase
MTVRHIVTFPHPALSKSSETINNFGDELNKLIVDLWDTLYASPGVGLAAPQIGVLKRISVIDISRTKAASLLRHVEKKLILINPILLSATGVQIPREGCLSVPDFLANIKRYVSVKIRSQDEKGEERIIEAEGFLALAIQHEIDHLDGKLFLDRVANLRTDLFRRMKYK